MPKKKIELEFGLHQAVPIKVDAAWGARLIYPDDLLHDRQGFYNWKTEAGQLLKHWLNNQGALRVAISYARRAADCRKITSDGGQQVILYQDKVGIIVGTPNTSHGYLYVAGWLHNGRPGLMPKGFEPLVFKTVQQKREDDKAMNALLREQYKVRRMGAR